MRVSVSAQKGEVRVLCAVHLNALEGSIFVPCSGPGKQNFNRMKLKITLHLGVISKNSVSLTVLLLAGM